jgi:hypothetical protein
LAMPSATVRIWEICAAILVSVKDGRRCRCGFGGLVIHVVAGHRPAYPGVRSAVRDGIKLPGAGDALELMPARGVEDKPGTGH